MLDRRIARTIRLHGLLNPSDRIALAVSGGADSVALAWLMRDVAGRPGIGAGIAGLIHVNHQLRGDESDRDEAFCRELAARLDWPIDVERIDVASRARAERRSVEAVARDARYACFTDAARRLGATVVATAHTLDDQAETVLLRLLRGAGGRVAGIRRRRGMFIRPLLDCRRADLRAYLSARGEMFCEDSSNQDQTIARNRIRHQLLPVIAQIAPEGLVALARFASLSGDDEDFLMKGAIEGAASVVSGKRDALELDARKLTDLPVPLARRLVRWAAHEASPQAAPRAAHVEAVRRLAAADKPYGHLDLPRLAVDRRGPLVVLSAARGPSHRATAEAAERPLVVPGSVDVPEAGVVVTAATEPLGLDGWPHGRDEAAVERASLALPLAVRHRRPGDRFRPLGAPGRRKLQDVFVDRKIPRAERDRLPIVVDANGRIVWVTGVGIAEECRVSTPSAGVVILKVRPL